MSDRSSAGGSTVEEVSTGNSVAAWEQSKVVSIRQSLHRYGLLLQEGKAGEAKRVEKEINANLDELCRRIDSRIKRFAATYIEGKGSPRLYMAPVITVEELHTELRSRFVKEIKTLDGGSRLNWEGYFYKALTFFANRVTREFS